MKMAVSITFSRIWYQCSTIFCANWYILFTAQKIGIKYSQYCYLLRKNWCNRGIFLLSSDKVEIHVRNIVIFGFFSWRGIIFRCYSEFLRYRRREMREVLFLRPLHYRHDLRDEFFLALTGFEIRIVLPAKISAEIVIDRRDNRGSVRLELRIIESLQVFPRLLVFGFIKIQSKACRSDRRHYRLHPVICSLHYCYFTSFRSRYQKMPLSSLFLKRLLLKTMNYFTYRQNSE